jgi:hypothetical protein
VIPPRLLASLVVSSLTLPVAISILVAVGRLLAAMGDAAGSVVIDRLALAAGIVWVVLLVVLVLVMGIGALERDRPPPEE